MKEQPVIRSEKPGDYSVIKWINGLAFGQSQEGVIIGKLREEKGFIADLSLLAMLGDKPVGHIMFFPVSIIHENLRVSSLSLGPMAVLPEFQKQGIGSRLVEHGLRQSKQLGFNSVIVLGHPEYYPRFGFRPASRWNITSPWEVPDEVFMAMELTGNALDEVSGKVVYPNAFNDAL